MLIVRALSCHYSPRLSNTDSFAKGLQFTLQEIDIMKRVFAAYPDDFAPDVDGSDAISAFRAGKLISPLGVEGLHQIANLAGNLRLYRDLGVRYATLTHNCHNKFADAALLESPLRVAPPAWNGLSDDGRKLVHEMNRIGMIVDLAHVRYVKPLQLLYVKTLAHSLIK